MAHDQYYLDKEKGKKIAVYEVKGLGDGWYNFTALPQEARYIKIASVRCLTDRKAQNQAKKILGDQFKEGDEIRII